MDKNFEDQEKLEVEEPVIEKTETAPTEDQDAKAAKKKKEKKGGKELEALQQEKEKLQQELQSCQEQFLRIRAEYDNFRKRSQSEKTALYNTAVSDAVNAILPVADNIERAVAQENATPQDIQKGLSMISAQFDSSLESLGVKAIGGVGEEFDPNLHNAVSRVEDESLGENVIAQVLQKGYVLGERVVRHAVVQVAN